MLKNFYFKFAMVVIPVIGIPVSEKQLENAWHLESTQ